MITTVNFFKKNSTPTLYLENGNIKFASFVDFKEFECMEKISFSTVNELISYYLDTIFTSRSFNILRKKLEKVALDEIKKIKNSMKFNSKDMDKYSEYEKYKNIGDILAANLYALKFGMKEAALFDFYTEQDVIITLNPEKSIVDNMKIYYDKFSKFKRGYNFNLEREIKLNEDFDYFNSVLTFINSSSSIEELIGIENELADLKYIKI